MNYMSSGGFQDGGGVKGPGSTGAFSVEANLIVAGDRGEFFLEAKMVTYPGGLAPGSHRDSRHSEAHR
jgi:hypothetical protein